MLKLFATHTSSTHTAMAAVHATAQDSQYRLASIEHLVHALEHERLSQGVRFRARTLLADLRGALRSHARTRKDYHRAFYDTAVHLRQLDQLSRDEDVIAFYIAHLPEQGDADLAQTQTHMLNLRPNEDVLDVLTRLHTFLVGSAHHRSSVADARKLAASAPTKPKTCPVTTSGIHINPADPDNGRRFGEGPTLGPCRRPGGHQQ
jgi:hypothetical protein